MRQSALEPLFKEVEVTIKETMMITTPKNILIFEDSKGKQPFTEWLAHLDIVTKNKIQNRILRLYHGNYGDYKVLQDGVKELRFYFGSGYRVYFGEDGKTLVILLCGGDKSSQAKDIKKANEYWKEYKAGNHD